MWQNLNGSNLKNGCTQMHEINKHIQWTVDFFLIQNRYLINN